MLKYRSLFGWGISIYAIMYLLWSGFATYGFIHGTAPHIVALVVLLVVAGIAGSSLHLASWKDILPYSIAWALMMGLLDAVYTVPYSNWTIYADWNLWVGYSLVAIVPLLTPFLRPLPTGHPT